ncbi:MAG: hypothetical protein RLZZ546_124 [Bacteroidota bacterium]|jgi:uncharacterized membrane protein
MITNDAVVLGLLFSILVFVFSTSESNSVFYKKFYTFFPPLLLCYFLPAWLNYIGIIDKNQSALYDIAKNYFLPASLILFCMCIDVKAVLGLGKKSIIMFFTSAIGVMIGGPIALYICKLLMPDLFTVYGEDLWKGLSTIAGSWIGGAPNQTAMKEIYHVPENIFATMLIIDVVVAYIWMALLLYGANHAKIIDNWLGADSSSIEELKQKSILYRSKTERIASTNDLVILFSIVFVGVGLSHYLGERIIPLFMNIKDFLVDIKMSSLLSPFFWVVVISTTIGLSLSFTKARSYEGIGASKFGTIFIYLLVCTLGMQIDLSQIFHSGSLFLLGFIWLLIHIVILFIVASIIKAPFFFVAVGSQACIGGPASAPVVASAFEVSLAPVGVILAVLGYAIGTYGAIVCAQLMSLI